MGKAPASMTRTGRAVAAVAGPQDAVVPALLEYQSPTAALIALPVPLASRHPGRVIMALVASVLAVLGLVPIDQVVTTTGKVTATTGNLIVQPLGASTSFNSPPASLVRAIYVKEGQIVRAGDLLAEFDPTFAQADVSSLEKQVASLQAEVERLTAETENRPYVPDGSPAGQLQALLYAQRHAERTAKLEDFTQQIEAARVSMVQARSDVASFSQRLRLAADVEAKRRELERLQVGSQLDRLQSTDTRMSVEAQLATARSQVASSQAQIDSLAAQRDGFLHQFNGDTSQKLTDQGRRLADGRELLNKATLARHLVQLRAERDAIVLRMAPVNVGAVMQPGDEFLQLVPLDAPLQIEAVVSEHDAGLVRVGDPVTIKFESFLYTMYGTASGTVRSVSPDSFKDEQSNAAASSPGPQAALGTFYFRARMSIDELQLHDLPEGARIVPGMPVEADVRVDKRTVLSSLFSRLIPAASEGMREP